MRVDRLVRVGELQVLAHGNARRPILRVLELRHQAVPHRPVARRDRVAVVPRGERAEKLLAAPIEELALVRDVVLLHLRSLPVQLCHLRLVHFVCIRPFAFRGGVLQRILPRILVLAGLSGNFRTRLLLPRRDELADHRRRLVAQLLQHLARLDDRGALFKRADVILRNPRLRHRRHLAVRLAHLGGVKAEDRVRRLAQHLGRRLVDARAHVLEAVDEVEPRLRRRVAGAGVPALFARKERQQLLARRLDARNRPRQTHVVRVQHRRVGLHPEGLLPPADLGDLEGAVGPKVRRRVELVVVHAQRRRVKVDQGRAQRVPVLAAQDILRAEPRVAAKPLHAL